MSRSKKFDVVIIGAGHNGLIAAAYLAKAGKKVAIFEAAPEVGGATASVRAFPEFDARLSRYSYLVSLLPDQICRDLNLQFESISREVSSYTPYTSSNDQAGGLFVARQWNQRSSESFAQLTGSDQEGAAWQDFYGQISKFAEKIAPSMLGPLPTRSELKAQIAMDEIWDLLIETPIGTAIDRYFTDDVVKGVVLTDALIGTHTSAYHLAANRCFLYHLIGNGTGEWKVPRGGMGALVNELVALCTSLGVEIRTNSQVISLKSSDSDVTVQIASGEDFSGDFLLSNAAPHVLAKLMGESIPPSLEGSQLKINMLVERLPRLKSGADPALAFAGTFHIAESFAQLERAFELSKLGQLPSPLPSEIYCHTLSDPSILGKDLQERGFHTLTLFGLHTPASLFDQDNDGMREQAQAAAFAALNEYLVDPIESVIARNSDGSLCVETKTPLDLEEAISLPRGNIFHRELAFPFREDGTAASWGVETSHPRILICGAGAIRGGGVSGIPGHNAAMAILQKD